MLADIKMGEASQPFRYIADPVCIASLILYTISRYFLKPHHIGGWFTHGYLNDILCLPLFVPIILYAQHVVGLRKHFGFPLPWEIFQNWFVFTVVFQVVIPRFPKTFIAAGDPYDILAYLAGGILAGLYWCSPRIPRRPARWRSSADGHSVA
jgi:hypothetical protein